MARTTSTRKRPRKSVVTDELEATEQHVEHLVSVIVDAAKRAQTPPAIAVLGAADFVARMVLHNIPPEARQAELRHLLTYIQQRLKELDDRTH